MKERITGNVPREVARKTRLRSFKEDVPQGVIIERALKLYLVTKPTDDKGRIKLRNYLRKL